MDKDYWERHWLRADLRSSDREIPPNPYLIREISDLTPGTALDAGCGEGTEAIWLVGRGWQVTAADISAEALARASDRPVPVDGMRGGVRWVEADLATWEPDAPFDLVTTHYAHPTIPQLEFYERISNWVAPGGTLLIVGHRHTPGAIAHGHEHGAEDHRSQPPDEVSVTAALVSDGLDPADWAIITAEEPDRGLGDRADRTVELRDVVVRASRRI